MIQSSLTTSVGKRSGKVELSLKFSCVFPRQSQVIQKAVTERSEVLDALITQAAGDIGAIGWLSPLASDKFAEYRDGDFLKLIGVDHSRRSACRLPAAAGMQIKASCSPVATPVQSGNPVLQPQGHSVAKTV